MAKKKDNKTVSRVPKKKEPLCTIKTEDSSVPNFSKMVNIGDRKVEIQCIDGEIKTYDKEVAAYLKTHNPFVEFESYNAKAKENRNLSSDKDALIKANQKLRAENKKLKAEIDDLSTYDENDLNEDGEDDDVDEKKKDGEKEKKGFFGNKEK